VLLGGEETCLCGPGGKLEDRLARLRCDLIDEPVRYLATLKQAVLGCPPTPRRGALTRRRLHRSYRARPSEGSYPTSNRHTPCAVATAPKCRTAGGKQVSPRCLIETLGRPCGWSVAFRDPDGPALLVPAAGQVPVGFRTNCLPSGSRRDGARKRSVHQIRIRSALAVAINPRGGAHHGDHRVDPHKASHTAVAICGDEREVAKVTVRATSQQTAKLFAWAEPLRRADLGHRVCRRTRLLVGTTRHYLMVQCSAHSAARRLHLDLCHTSWHAKSL
jgi:hypothetical protein